MTLTLSLVFWGTVFISPFPEFAQLIVPYQIFAAAAYRYDEEVLFTINYRNDITTACFVEYGGVKYNVNRIDTFEGYKQDLTLYCKRK